MRHAFDTEIAKKYGVHAAIVLDNLYFWIRKNTENNKNYHDGRYWTYNSKKALAESFPYLSSRQIEYALIKLLDARILIAENYNESKYDRTLWYALTDFGFSILQNCEMENAKLCNAENKNVECISQNCGMETTKLLNRNTKFVEPIPDSKPDITTDNKSNDDGDGGRRGRTRVNADEGQSNVDNQEVSLEVRAAEAADNRPTHDQEDRTDWPAGATRYGNRLTTPESIVQVDTLMRKLFKQYRCKAPTQADNQRGFELLGSVQPRADDKIALFVFDEQRAALLEYAFEQASESGDTGWRYINGIYKRFAERGVKTVEDAYAYERQRSSGDPPEDIFAKFF